MVVNKKSLYRIIDSNFNRAKEGLRVCEDVCRFILNVRVATKQCKDIRHELTEAIVKMNIVEIIKARDIEGDVGKATLASELRRKNVKDVFLANMQRVKESMRVLEEFAKMINKDSAKMVKSLRYKVYCVEKKVIEKI